MILRCYVERSNQHMEDGAYSLADLELAMHNFDELLRVCIHNKIDDNKIDDNKIDEFTSTNA
jgi:hypothetical protein